MATATRTPATDSGVVPYRLTLRQFETMIDAGVFPEGTRVELLGGMLVDKMTKNPPHSIASGQTRDLLARIVPPGWYVDEEKPIALGLEDRPEPDVTVVLGRRNDYRDRAPGPKHLALVVEVSDVSYGKDRGEKWWRYAAARVRTYWIVHLAARQVEVYTDPTGRGKAACYRACVIHGADAEVPVVIEDHEVGRIAVREILPEEGP
ncbi:MAG TPA: Uma2 family endonuclease [Isosphaeraceae bacterium]|jgi:Uma2 family endonuclease